MNRRSVLTRLVILAMALLPSLVTPLVARHIHPHGVLHLPPDWAVFLAVGVVFTLVGSLKIYGYRRGIVGGGGKPFKVRLQGSCPTWSKHVNTVARTLFLVIGLGFLGASAWIAFHP